MVVVTIAYRSGPKFDWDYYLSHHVPMSEKVMRPFGLQRAEVRKVGPSPFGTECAYQTLTTLYFDTMENLQRCMQQPELAALQADVANFYDGAPEFYMGEAVYSE